VTRTTYGHSDGSLLPAGRLAGARAGPSSSRGATHRGREPVRVHPGASSGKAGVCIRRKAQGDGGRNPRIIRVPTDGGGRRPPPPSPMVDTPGCRAVGRGMGELGRDKRSREFGAGHVRREAGSFREPSNPSRDRINHLGANKAG
jgi:hypothetical protein